MRELCGKEKALILTEIKETRVEMRSKISAKQEKRYEAETISLLSKEPWHWKKTVLTFSIFELLR